MKSADTLYRSTQHTARDGFAQLLRAEWTKFRTVRGWIGGLVAAAAALVLVGLLTAAGSRGPCPDRNCEPVVGPGGEAVTDTFYFVHRPLDGDGEITVPLSALTGVIAPGRAEVGSAPGLKNGLQSWAKAGLIVKAGTAPGSTYAAVMLTGGHGARMQYDYVHDVAGRPGTAPRWLRLTRSGATITGYESADGQNWSTIGSATLDGLPATVEAGMFVTSPAQEEESSTQLGGGSGTKNPTLATAVFGKPVLRGAWGDAWHDDVIGGDAIARSRIGAGGSEPSGDGLKVSGTGDIAPAVGGQILSLGVTVERALVGAFAGLILVIIVAAAYTTSEYRRGLIRVTLAASPGRGRVLTAKALVIGTVTFAAGLVAAGIAAPLGSQVARSNGYYLHAVPAATYVRVVAGTAALLAVAAVFTLAVGIVTRRGAGAVATVGTAMVLPYILATASVLPDGPSEWLLRVTPAAAFAIQQSIPEYPQVAASYTPTDGYYPLSPWAGFGVLCGYTAVALALALVLTRRRDA